MARIISRIIALYPSVRELKTEEVKILNTKKTEVSIKKKKKKILRPQVSTNVCMLCIYVCIYVPVL